MFKHAVGFMDLEGRQNEKTLTELALVIYNNDQVKVFHRYIKVSYKNKYRCNADAKYCHGLNYKFLNVNGCCLKHVLDSFREIININHINYIYANGSHDIKEFINFAKITNVTVVDLKLPTWDKRLLTFANIEAHKIKHSRNNPCKYFLSHAPLCQQSYSHNRYKRGPHCALVDAWEVYLTYKKSYNSLDFIEIL